MTEPGIGQQMMYMIFARSKWRVQSWGRSKTDLYSAWFHTCRDLLAKVCKAGDYISIAFGLHVDDNPGF